MEWLAFESPAAQAAALSQAIAAELKLSIENQGRAVLVVSGGRSPVALFDLLAQCQLPWHRVVVTLVDERLVPEDHPDSNAALVRKHLLQGFAAEAQFIPLVTHADDEALSLAEACKSYIWPTVVVLGMGDDGHTASLFPNAPELAAGLDLAQKQPIIAVTPPVAAHRRLSMTRAALLKCDKMFLAIQGENKRAVFERARLAEDINLPVSYFLHQKATPLDVYWAP